ncbi:hypothetical protein D3C84_1152400 [compost metagenome]
MIQVDTLSGLGGAGWMTLPDAYSYLPEGILALALAVNLELGVDDPGYIVDPMHPIRRIS